jgi:hypothetical protein
MEPIRRRVHRSSSNGTAVSTTTLGRNRRIGSSDTLERVTSAPDSVRFHIPRTLRLIYDVRNKRDVAHLADGIDPNQQDATLVVRNMEWVLAELVRLCHNVSPAEVHGIIADLVSKDVPLIQVFDGFPRVLKAVEGV